MKRIYLLLILPFLFGAKMYATTHSILVEDFEFNPGNLNVSVGDTIIWMWDNGGSEHTTTSTSVPEGASMWDHTLNASSSTFSYVVTQPGTYQYHCTIHTTMTGSFTATGTAGIAMQPDVSASITNMTLFNNALQVTYSLDKSSSIEIILYDINGRQIHFIAETFHIPGSYNESYPVADLSLGIYFVEFKTNDIAVTRKVMGN